MKSSFLSGLTAVIIAMGLPGLAFSDCMKSAMFGEYVLGNHGDVDRYWAVNVRGETYNDSDTVRFSKFAKKIGNFNRKAGNAAELEQFKNQLMRRCERKGDKIIAKMEDYFYEVQEDAADRFDAKCADPAYCARVRDTAIEQDIDSIDGIRSAYLIFIEKDIIKCKQNFEAIHDAISDLMCY